MSRKGSLDCLHGQVLATRYRIGEQLGAGAMGTVFRAEHVKVGRALAVKVLHPRMLQNAKYRRRFEREAELAGKLRHPNVAGVMDVGVTPEGLHYLVMEYADGPTLAALLEDGPLEAARVIDLVKQLCEGLHHAHEHGLIHRDFKPDNVIVERDRYGTETPRILDFGIAIALEDTLGTTERERLTTAGLVLGTPHYMAPEHASGQAIDHRIDLFALGVIMYEMLTGLLPFDGDGVDVARAYLSRPIPPMRVRAPEVEVDPLLEAFTRALLVRERDARPPSAKAARDLLALIAQDRPAAAGVLGVRLPEGRRTVPVSAPPPPARAQRPSSAPPVPRAPGAQRPSSAPPLGWTELPTETMSAIAKAAAVAAVAVPMPSAEETTPPPGELATTGTPPRGVPVIAEPARAPSVSVYVPRQLPAFAEVPRAPRSEPDEAEDEQEPQQVQRRVGWIAPAVIAVLGVVVVILAVASRNGAAPPQLASPAEVSAEVVATQQKLQPTTMPSAMPPAMPPTMPPAMPIEQAALEPSPLPAPAPAPTAPASPAAQAQAPAPRPATTAPTTPAPPRPRPRPTTKAPPAPAPLAPADELEDPPTGALAEQYGAVGRLLKQLADTHGQEATLDLWPRYRTIRIFEALGARDRRIAALGTLRFLEREIARRSR